MSENVNPNSRAAFVSTEGRLTKYGIDVLQTLFRAIGLNGQLSDLEDLHNNADVDLGVYTLRSSLRTLSAQVADLKESESHGLMSKIRVLDKRITDLENSQEQPINMITILKRLDDIEAQL